jgi:hypothetical protein
LVLEGSTTFNQKFVNPLDVKVFRNMGNIKWSSNSYN